MTPPDKFVFINRSGSGPSKRDAELQISKVRAHAATVSHQRSKEKSQRAKQKQDTAPTGGWQTDLNKGVASVPYRNSQLPTPPLSPDEEDIYGAYDSSSPGAKTAWFITPEDSPETPADCDSIQDPGEVAPYSTRPSAIFPSADANPRYMHTFSLNLEAFRGLRSDPFLCIPSAADQRVATTIDFYCQDLMPRYDLVCDVFNVTNLYAFFLDCIADQYFYHAGLAALQLVLDQQRAPGSIPSIHVFKHRGHAIARLRKKLLAHGATCDDITLFAMTFLATLEGALGNFAAHRLHKDSIATVIKQRGGLRALQDGSLLKATLMQYDTFWAMATGSTMFPGERRPYSPIYPEHPFPPKLLLAISTLPSGFENLAMNRLLSFDTLQLLFRATDRTRTDIHVLRRKQAERRRMSRPWNDFWEACPAFGMLDDQGCNLLEKLICLTLIVYCCLAFDDVRSVNNVLRGARAELSQKIASLHPPHPPDVLPELARVQLDCHLWMWTVTIDAWRVSSPFSARHGPSLSPDGMHLFRQLLNKYPAQARELAALKHVTAQFLWTAELDRSLDMYWERLAREVTGLP